MPVGDALQWRRPVLQHGQGLVSRSTSAATELRRVTQLRKGGVAGSRGESRGVAVRSPARAELSTARKAWTSASAGVLRILDPVRIRLDVDDQGGIGARQTRC
jgi:hypothetical protein